ncbi:hypothetical protein J6590_038039 [Homalodisca vitripennis]|nr:hypothetical protein J6590_038039 [Homalodisca vitripennis]
MYPILGRLGSKYPNASKIALCSSASFLLRHQPELAGLIPEENTLATFNAIMAFLFPGCIPDIPDVKILTILPSRSVQLLYDLAPTQGSDQFNHFLAFGPICSLLDRMPRKAACATASASSLVFKTKRAHENKQKEAKVAHKIIHGVFIWNARQERCGIFSVRVIGRQSCRAVPRPQTTKYDDRLPPAALSSDDYRHSLFWSWDAEIL